MPAPPYSSSTVMPCSPSAPSSGHSSIGKRSVRSISAASGAIRSSAKSRTVVRSMSISGPRSKSREASRVLCTVHATSSRLLRRYAPRNDIGNGVIASPRVPASRGPRINSAKQSRRRLGWCGREDSNFHGVSPTATSTLRVYQFRHDRTTGRGDYQIRAIISTRMDPQIVIEPNQVEWRISRRPIDYHAAVAEMEERVAVIRAEAASELVWLLEHPPLYTAGTSARDEDLLEPDRLPVHRTGRGGCYTYHGPGQRIAYVMLDLR